MTEAKASVAAPEKSRGHWLSNPVQIDRTREYRNKLGEVVPFDVAKICSRCGTEKDLWAEFHYRSDSSDLHQAWCKACVKEHTKGRKNTNQGGKLATMQGSMTIHVGQEVRNIKTVPVITAPVIVPQEDVATFAAEAVPNPMPEVEAETQEVPMSTATVEAIVTVEETPAPVEEQASGIVSVATVEEPRFAPRVLLSSFVEFNDWITSPDTGHGFFMTRGAEAIVMRREDGMCWITTPNQSGPQQWITPELTPYILKLLTKESTDEALVGILYC